MLWVERSLLDAIESPSHGISHSLTSAYNPLSARITRATRSSPQPCNSLSISQQALLAVIWRVNQDSVECVLELWCQIRWPVAVVLDKAF